MLADYRQVYRYEINVFPALYELWYGDLGLRKKL